MSENRTQNAGEAVLPATSAAQALGSHPIGSMQSRAAARMLLEQRRSTEKRRELILADDRLGTPSATDWTRERDGTLSRTVCFPGGANMAECLRQVGGFNDAEIAEIVEHHPTVPDFEIMMLER